MYLMPGLDHDVMKRAVEELNDEQGLGIQFYAAMSIMQPSAWPKLRDRCADILGISRDPQDWETGGEGDRI
jgi:hypothetical protein